MDNIQFGAFIAQLRREQGLTQKELADKLNVTDKAVSKWESGQGKPDVDNIVKLTEVYHVSADYILLGIEQEKTVIMPAKKELCHEYRKAIATVIIIAGMAVVTVLFITALGLLSRFGI